jgi:hypothetical protein
MHLHLHCRKDNVKSNLAASSARSECVLPVILALERERIAEREVLSGELILFFF